LRVAYSPASKASFRPFPKLKKGCGRMQYRSSGHPPVQCHEGVLFHRSIQMIGSTIWKHAANSPFSLSILRKVYFWTCNHGFQDCPEQLSVLLALDTIIHSVLLLLLPSHPLPLCCKGGYFGREISRSPSGCNGHPPLGCPHHNLPHHCQLSHTTISTRKYGIPSALP
jgi:hypothetical protein